SGSSACRTSPDGFDGSGAPGAGQRGVGAAPGTACGVPGVVTAAAPAWSNTGVAAGRDHRPVEPPPTGLTVTEPRGRGNGVSVRRQVRNLKIGINRLARCSRVKYSETPIE